jgi:hypothetical protein
MNQVELESAKQENLKVEDIFNETNQQDSTPPIQVLK